MDKKILRKIKRNDSLAALAIRAGGMLVIASVILILLLIGREALPLFSAPEANVAKRLQLPEVLQNKKTMAVGVDEYLEIAYVVTADGSFVFIDLATGKPLKTLRADLAHPRCQVVEAQSVDDKTISLRWSDGQISLERVVFRQDYDQTGQRFAEISLKNLAHFTASLDPVVRSVVRSVVRQGEQGLTLVRQGENNQLEVVQWLEEEDLFGNRETAKSSFRLSHVHPDDLTAITLDGSGRTLFAGTKGGALLRWDLSTAGRATLLDKVQAFRDGRQINALRMLMGELSLAVGDSEGEITVWFPAPTEEGEGTKRLQLIHSLSQHDSAVDLLIPSPRNRTLLSLDRDGALHLDYSTSERHLLSIVEQEAIVLATLSVRGDAVIGLQQFTDGPQLTLWNITNPHPEISLSSLFGKVWYESYQQPDWVWQSSSASDDFEAKFSLMPLIYGTLKGTFYAMVFAIPLALFGAIYTSQFGSRRLRNVIKPAVEIMAAVPSVIIGFLAALWFAPLLERHFPGFLLSILIVPLAFILLLILWQPLRDSSWAKRVEGGHEFIVMAPLLILAVAIGVECGPWFEQVFFAGNFKLWLFGETGLRYDSRNSIVIAFALGFAVIPIIFTITEDALSNVPGSLKAASLALGASRWQTVWRVVLPSASPGIFAAVMIGLGRAVGETMIVLMATGNTPIMEMSIFNGMRPLSANIAVEIPEAPHGDTLYRILFLSAVLLFVLTFVLNTVAEVVRERLRRKYGRF